MPYDITDAKEDIEKLAAHIESIYGILKANKLIPETAEEKDGTQN